MKALGTGGRKIREDSGDCWDHYDITFTYPNDVHLNLNSFQGGKALSDVSIRLFGAKGVAELHYMGVVGIYGENLGNGRAAPGRFRLAGARQHLLGRGRTAHSETRRHFSRCPRLSRAAGVAPHIGRPKWKPVPSSYPIGEGFPASDLRCLRMLNSATSSASPMSKIWPYIAIATTI